MATAEQPHKLNDRHSLIDQIRRRLDGNGLTDDWGLDTDQGKIKGSAVLFLLTLGPPSGDGSPEPCLLLNKRSQHVLQPGDLCCPGGGMAPVDRLVSRALHWPFSPLKQWPAWHQWKRVHPRKASGLALLMATAMRECWEEMRLNPLKIAFMGPLPIQKLVMFERQIYPLVGWVARDQHLVPNWEVARIIHIPLRRLLDPLNYARYRLSYDTTQGESRPQQDFPCFIHRGQQGHEILWGATFRITMDFLRLVYGFELPDLSDAQVIGRELDESYLNGSSAHAPRARDVGSDDF